MKAHGEDQPVSGMQRKAGPSNHSKRRGQGLVELALVLPMLMVLLVGIADVGLGLQAWLEVNNAARDATRFALDAGTANDITSLALTKLGGLDTTPANIYIINGKTDASGTLPNSSPNWVVDHHYGAGPATANVQPATIQALLQTPGDPTANHNLPFVIVEVDLNYIPLILGLFAPGSSLPMTSYAIIQTPH